MTQSHTRDPIKYYCAERFFDGQKITHNHVFAVQHGRLVTAPAPTEDTIQQLAGLITAGFIDVQVNGGGGVLFNDSPSTKNTQIIFNAHCAFGTTALLPTLITDSHYKMQQAADAISQAIKQNQTGILGVHFEGPHLSKSKKGVHAEQYIRPLSSDDMALYARQDLGIKVITVAPETVSPEQIEALVAHDVIVCLGHSNATHETTLKALKAGATGFTHLFNAMSAFTSREPGVTGTALSSPTAWNGIIVDNYHVHPVSAKLAVQTKPTRTFLVTDSMSTVGSNKSTFKLFGSQVKDNNGKLTDHNGTLAGSSLNMAQAVFNCVHSLQLPLENALNMASLFPAQFLGIDNNYGSLSLNKKANFIQLNDNLNVVSSWVNGEQQNQQSVANNDNFI